MNIELIKPQDKLEIIIKGIPVPKQSMRQTIRKNKFGGQFIQNYQSAEVIKQKDNIIAQVLSQLPNNFRPFTIPLIVTKLHYIFPIPSSMTKKKIKLIEQGQLIRKYTKPDITDNLNKGLFDSLEGIVYVNDSLITDLDDVKKYYGFVPQTILVLEPLNISLY